MNREQAFATINETQEYYVEELIKSLNSSECACLKEHNFTSDTGTGKTKMMAMLCNKMPDKFFVITTLSRGQLQNQIRTNLSKDIKQDNFVVYGLCDFTANTKLQAEDIIAKLPQNKDIVWLRDEGHIHTNKWQALINDKCWKIVNISATNKEEGIRCNFTHTMMLRTVIQQEGTPEDALDKLLQIKKQHKKVKKYNPCAIMRCLDAETTERVIRASEHRNLKYINITEEAFDMSQLCEDDNEYDVIINKFKIVEGIDLKRAHVIYMTNEPKNPATTIQIIGRARRNALLYRKDIDIFAPENRKLLENTRQCFVYYNVQGMNIDTDEYGNLCSSFCNYISCQKLKPNTYVEVENGMMNNGLQIIELAGQSGKFKVEIDESTGFNVVIPYSKFYEERVGNGGGGIIYVSSYSSGVLKYNLREITSQLTLSKHSRCKKIFNKESCRYEEVDTTEDFGYDLMERYPDITVEIKAEQVNAFIDYINNFKIEEIVGTKQNKKSVSLIYKIKEERQYNYWLDLEHGTIIDPHSTNLNQELLDLFFYNTEKKKSECFATNEELEKRKEEILQESIYNVLPNGMERDKSFVLVYKNKFKVHGKYIARCQTRQIKDGIIPIQGGIIFENQLENISEYVAYRKIQNDRELAIIGTDIMKPIKTENGIVWIEDKAVTSKISKYSKLNTFIESKYANQINEIKNELYQTNKRFDFDTKCNSCLGYCVEYYGKYLVYGKNFLKGFLQEAQKEAGYKSIRMFDSHMMDDGIIVRACMLMYRKTMMEVYGESMKKLIRAVSVEQLISQKYKSFIETVVKLGQNVATFIKKELDINSENNEKRYDPNLSVEHISGLADFIDKNKIVDIKCTGCITMQHIKQVLAYHYLSTKRSDLDIQEVIVFDAINNKCVRIKVQ